ncbi:hypothetical protein GCM10007242_40180 [Pigmentiphaga litoralis]|uniref:DUF808 domain-containing protein n=1 Tax=Pigmentiphaga litoralis TaxID=516702 RepID=UPI001674796F|nr:DUF808 domain-containing protein [Pigmentiphaga litoralis]GGX29569.1 hypothetical protein GCM10007242_40180 [Pigmentiphaga litoralis]
MAGSSFFALLDDIATMLDDVSIMTKVALKKTAGVLGDDLALNAQQVTGVPVNRELPVVWAVARGSFINKLILVPSALAISAFAPWLVTPLLMVGGAYLCFEGAEKLAHRFLPDSNGHHAHAERAEALKNPQVDMVAFEKEKIKGAVRTDFILSAEIIAITLGAVATGTFTEQVVVLSGIAILMTVGVYGLVAGIVKLDDLGLYLTQKASSTAKAVGAGIVRAAPVLMKTLSIVGTAAMFMVGGSILTHGIPVVAHTIEGWAAAAGTIGGIGWLLQASLPTVCNALFGIVAGGAVMLVVEGVKKLFKKNKTAAH